MDFKEIINYRFVDIGSFHLDLQNVITAVVIIILARFLMWAISRISHQFFKKKKIDVGRQYAFLQVVKYVVYTSTLLIVLETFNISLSLLWGGAAALLVGVGLGLQHTFNDLISGLILLFEGTVMVDDVIETDGIIGTVMAIGIRTSKVETLDHISILIPNSKLVGNKATNWSHNKASSRFQLTVGVAYKSDIDVVTALLLQAAEEHGDILQIPKPEVEFSDFGNSSLDFVLHYYSYEFRRMDFVKSELRYRLLALFGEHNIEIPFPQTDLWLRSSKSILPLDNGYTM